MCFIIFVSKSSNARKSNKVPRSRGKVTQWARDVIRTLCCIVARDSESAGNEADTRSHAAADVPIEPGSTSGHVAATFDVAVSDTENVVRGCRSESPTADRSQPYLETSDTLEPGVLPRLYVYNCEPPNGRPYPDPDSGFYHRLLVCAPAIVGIRLVGTYGTEVKVQPKRLTGLSLEHCIRPLHQPFTIDEIADFIERERRARIRHLPIPPCTPWLREIGRAAESLGFSEHLLADELLACAGRRPEKFAQGGISSLIEGQSWTNLARRICVDKAMLRFAFHAPDEANARRKYRAYLKQLECRYFNYIFEREPGEFIDCIPKGASLDEPRPAESSAAPLNGDKVDSEKAASHDSGGGEESEDESDDSGDESGEDDDSDSDRDKSEA